MKPTAKELWEAYHEELDTYTEVHSESEGGWKHGTFEIKVFIRNADNTYWEVEYTKSTDNEHHGFRDGEAGVNQVVPKQIIKTVYELYED